MADKKDQNKGKPPQTFSNEDDLRALAMRDVKPLRGKTAKKAARRAAAPPGVRETIGAAETVKGARGKTAARIMTGKGLDARTDERLRAGKMEIDARIDLHGLRLGEAEGALKKTLLKCQAQDKRCILVITGKGARRGKTGEDDWWESKPGVIRTSLPEWLKASPLRDIVLRCYPAQPRHGGSGAFYVLLRRKRAA